jgi:tol-pal system protein YbgF
MNRPGFLLAALMVLGAAPAHALFDDDEARARIDQLRRETSARFDKLESAQRGQIELANQIEALRQDIARLRGQMEVAVHELDQLQKRQKDFYVDLDVRLRKLEQAAVEATARHAEPPAAPKKDAAAEARDYEAALNLFRSGKFKESAAAFEALIAAHPNGDFQSNAHYWLGNSLFQQKDFKRASEAFNKVLLGWPSDSKAPDALLGLANSQQELGDAKAARASLEALVARYPDSPAAQKAKPRLAPAPAPAAPKKKG